MATPAINVQNLTKNYGPVLAVDDITFEVKAGELVGFLGPNGAGKSTTMRILTTFLPASKGYAWVAGFDVMYQSMEVRQRIGYLPESVPLYPEMRVREYLSYRARLKGVERSGRTARLDYCMERCRIKEVKNRLLGTLSKGYRQRVGLADTLLADPPVLILDEPTSGLDPIAHSELRDIVGSLRGEGKTVFLSSHQLADVELICTRVAIIHNGKLLITGTIKELTAGDVTEITVQGAQMNNGMLPKLKAIAPVVEQSNGMLQMRANEADKIAAIIDAVRGVKGDVVSIVPHKRTLEEVFVETVQKEEGA